MIMFRNMHYFSTGKTGTNLKTGKPVVEMEADDYSRVWVAADGTVFPE